MKLKKDKAAKKEDPKAKKGKAGKDEKDAKPKPKRRLLLLIPIVLLVAVGVVAGLHFTGRITLPFLAKAKPGSKASRGKAVVANVKKAPSKPAPKPVTPPPVVKPPVVTPPSVTVATKKVVPTVDADKGARKLAQLWEGMEAEALTKVIANWRDADLAKVMAKMDADKVAEVLTGMPPAKASTLSRAIQREASRLPVEKT